MEFISLFSSWLFFTCLQVFIQQYKDAGQLWRCLWSSHCVNVIMVHLSYVSGEHRMVAPPYLPSPPSVPHLTPGNSAFFLSHSLSLYLSPPISRSLFVSHTHTHVDSFCGTESVYIWTTSMIGMILNCPWLNKAFRTCLGFSSIK